MAFRGVRAVRSRYANCSLGWLVLWATPDTPGVFLAGRRLVAIDGTCLHVADTPENTAFFGRACVNKGEQTAFSLARVVALAEYGTHAT
jgi:hypothetical protein